MRLPEQFLEELKARAPIVNIISQKVRLKPAGSGRYRGLCPFHEEKTPSFNVDETKGFFHCFGCKASGTAVHFVMRTENLGFLDAVRKVAPLAGMEVPRTGARVDPGRARRMAQVRDALTAAHDYFRSELAAEGGARARAYLQGRGVRDSHMSQFELGFAPNRGGDLPQRLRAAGIALDTQIDAGLLARDDQGRTYPFFRHRVTFPIADHLGNLVAFGGRALDSNARAKYLNSRESVVFSKGRTLYNLHRAREAAPSARVLYIVEGYMDVIALAAHGVGAAVAPLGTALTPDQVRMAWRLHDEPTVCMDGDDAGRAAAVRAMENVLPLLGQGRSLRFLFLPPGSDPDSFVRDQGPEALEALSDEAQHLVDLAWQTEYERESLDTPERKAHFQERLKRIVQTIEDRTVRNAYHDEFSRRYQDTCQGTLESGEARSVAGSRRSWPRGGGVRQPFAARGRDRLVAERHRDRPQTQGAAHRERAIIQAIICVPGLIDRVEERFAGIPFRALPGLDEVRTELLHRHARSDPFDPESVRPWLDSHGLGDVLDGGVSSDRWDHRLVEPFARPDCGLEFAQTGWEAAVELQLEWVQRTDPPTSSNPGDAAPPPSDAIPWSPSHS